MTVSIAILLRQIMCLDESFDRKSHRIAGYIDNNQISFLVQQQSMCRYIIPKKS